MTAQALAFRDVIEQHKPGFQAKVGIVLGSGLGSVADQLTDVVSIPFDHIPGFPTTSVEGHSGLVHLGWLHDIPVICLQGRVHFYEGGGDEQIKTLIRSIKVAGAKQLLLTNSAGSLNADVGVGEVVAITDHINMQFHNPLVGPNDDAFGDRFTGMENAYDPDIRSALRAAAVSEDIALHEGVYLGVLGPSFETPAEIRAYRTLGADLVGMSTVADVIVARHCGLQVAALSGVTNLAAGMHDEQLSHAITLEGAAIAAKKIATIIGAWVKAQQGATHG